MKKSVIRFGAGLLAAMLLFTGCGMDGRKAGSSGNAEGTAKVSKPNEFPIVEEPVELAIFTTKPTGVEDITTNEFTKWYEEKTNVKIKWDLISGDARQAINIKLASDDYSDIFLGFSFAKSEQSTYYDQGVYIDMTDVVDKHGYYIKKMFEENPSIEKELRHTDNMLLGLSDEVGNFEGSAPHKMWLYKPWMDKLGLEVPTTTDELYEVLKAFKEKDPNGNGKADEIPLAARGQFGSEIGLDIFLMNAFLPWGRYGFTNIDGKAVFAPIQEEAKEGIRYIKKLYDEGLIHTDSFVMDRSRVTALAENEVPILGAATGRWTTQFTAAGTSNRMNEYIPMPPLSSPVSKARTTGAGGSGGCTTFSITTDCEEPAVAVKWIDWFYSMDGYLASKSTDGTRLAKEGEIGLDGTQAILTVEPAESGATFDGIQNVRWSGNFIPGYLAEEVSFKTADFTADAERKKTSYGAYQLYKPFEERGVVINDFPMPTEVGEEYLELRTNFMSAISSGVVGFIIGEKDIDKDWDAYVANFENIGLERYTEIIQEYAIDAQK
ncbi:MAG: extracellular solute-binding protein [Ruminococcaceae bacterium]|nr:extracellular solute-binding protein [Oscillospiraceae bacterium]